MAMPDLKPCPFCGGEAEVRDGHIFMTDTKVVTCKKCHVRTTPVSVDHPYYTSRGLDESTRYTPEQATQIACGMWNRRENDSFPIWISVEERLPEICVETRSFYHSVTVLASENGRIMMGYFTASKDDGSYDFTGVDSHKKFYDFAKPSHWMPLPEPPKEVPNA